MPALITSASINSKRLVVDVSKSISLLFPNKTPLTLITQKLNKQAGNTEFSCLSEENRKRSDTTSAATAIATSITAANIARWHAFDTAVNLRTNEQIHITTATATTGTAGTLVAVRGRNTGGTGQAINAGDTWAILGPSYAEGAASITAWNDTTDDESNYCETVEDAWAASMQLENSMFTGEKEMPFRQRKTLIDHAASKEAKFILGRKYNDTTNEHYYTGGLWEYITTNVFTPPGGNLTESVLTSWLRAARRYGSSEKTLFCDDRTYGIICNIFAGKCEIKQSEKTMGLVVNEILSGDGRIWVVEHKLFRELGLSGCGIFADTNYLGYRYIANMDGYIKENVQANDAVQRKDMIVSTCGLYRCMEKAHAKFSGVLA